MSYYAVYIEGSKQILYEESSDSLHSSKYTMRVGTEHVKKSKEKSMDETSIVEQRKILIQGLKRRLSETIPHVGQKQSLHQFNNEIDTQSITVRKKSAIDHDSTNDMEHEYCSKFDKVRNEGSSFATKIQKDNFLMAKDYSLRLLEKPSPQKIVNGNLGSNSSGIFRKRSGKTVRYTKVSETKNTTNFLNKINQFFRRFGSGNSMMERPHSETNFPSRRNKGHEPMSRLFCKQSCFTSLKKKISNVATCSPQIHKCSPYCHDSIPCSKQICVSSLCNIRKLFYIYLQKLKSCWERIMSPIIVHIRIHMLHLPDNMKKNILIFFKGIKTLFRFGTASRTNVQISLSTLITSMLAEIYPTVPRHCIALSCFFFYVKSKEVSLTSPLTFSGMDISYLLRFVISMCIAPHTFRTSINVLRSV